MNNVVDFPQKIQALQNRLGAPVDGGGEPPNNGGMEARLARLEAIMESVDRRLGGIETGLHEVRRDQRADFRIMFGALISAALGLAFLIAKGAGWL